MPEEVYLKVNGKNLDPYEMEDLLSVVVDTSLNMPSMFSILLNVSLDVETAKVQYIDDEDKFVPGQEVEIKIATDELADEPNPVEAVFKGEIVALEPRFNEGGGASLLIRAYDRSHRLTRGRKTVPYLDQKDSDIAKKLAGNAGLSPEVDATTTTHDYVLQDNETDWEFLVSRARRNGFCVYCEDNKLYFKKEPPGGEAVALVWGQNLRKFDSRVSTAGQVSEVVVRGWDPNTKKPIVGKATSLKEDQPKPGGGEKGPDVAKSGFGKAEGVVVERPVADQDEAQALAQGILDEIGRGFIEADCESMGDPRIRAGVLVSLENLGQRFSGKYRVTRAVHRYERGSLTTEFSIGGRHVTTIAGLLEAKRNGSGPQPPVMGIVTNIDDPKMLGRVKVKIPSFKPYKDAEIDLDWARVAAPMAGAERGMFYLPEIDDEVFIAFELGDVHRPVVVGGMWNSKDKPPEGTGPVVDGGKVCQRILRSRSGHVIILNDKDGEEQIIIRDKTEKNEIVIDSANNTITVRADKDITIEAKGKMDLTSTGDMTLKSDGDMNIDCVNLNVKAQASGKVEAGAKLDLTATGALTAKGGTAALESDGTTEVKSSGMVKVQGSVIMLN